MSIASQKQKLRKDLLHTRRHYDPSTILVTSELVSMNFFSSKLLKKDQVLAGYYPTNGEISPLPILLKAQVYGYRTALPRVVGMHKKLEFHQWHMSDLLEVDKRFGICEPLRTSTVVSPRIFMVPLIAYNRKGRRLGMGGGFYDRTIEAVRQEHKDTIFVGLAYEWQYYEDLPHADHDAILDYVINEKEVICCGNKKTNRT